MRMDAGGGVEHARRLGAGRHLGGRLSKFEGLRKLQRGLRGRLGGPSDDKGRNAVLNRALDNVIEALSKAFVHQVDPNIDKRDLGRWQAQEAWLGRVLFLLARRTRLAGSPICGCSGSGAAAATAASASASATLSTRGSDGIVPLGCRALVASRLGCEDACLAIRANPIVKVRRGHGRGRVLRLRCLALEALRFRGKYVDLASRAYPISWAHTRWPAFWRGSAFCVLRR
mmetsp:Transcript_31918/g.76235  ORF Transcript_31918/g.76235 Transcript_31918/m.76235 type:complete len:229 (-) Transcript_31918:155-841(-)